MKSKLKTPRLSGRVSLPIMLTGLILFSALTAPSFAQGSPAADAPPTGEPQAGIAGRLPVQEEAWNALMLPVSVRLNNATVKQMAEAISKVSKLPIEVDDSVPDTVRITLEAHRIPVATLLEAMARRAELLIARSKDEKGVLLTRPPLLKVDNTDQPIGRDATYPWSEEWGIPPSAVVKLPMGLSDTYTSGPQSGIVNIPAATNPSLSNFSTIAANPIAPLTEYEGFGRAATNPNQKQNLTYTSVGNNLLVVSEPGKGEKGEAGVWLTVYRIDKNGSITRLQTIFHPYKEPPPQFLPSGALLPTPAPDSSGAKPATPAPESAPSSDPTSTPNPEPKQF